MNQAYAVMVASQFQGFCRDLHTESVAILIDHLDLPTLFTPIIRNRFVDGRQLESRNAQPGSIGSDFGWFGVEFWDEANALLADNKAAMRELGVLNDWRNAIAHQNFKAVSPGAKPSLTLNQVRRWRRLCNRLARTFGRVMGAHLGSLIGLPPGPHEDGSMSAIKKTKPRFRVGDPVSFLYGPRRITGEVIEDRGPLGAHGRRIFLIRASIGQDEPTMFEVPEDNLDDPSQADEDNQQPGTRIEFSVTYARRGATSVWRPTVKRGRVYQGIKAKGAVAYSTARWEGESQDDERRGIVAVLLEPRPGEGEASLAAEARRLADRMFLDRHPNAEIED